MRDIKYIIKKVIIGVAIGVSMFYLKSNVFALTTEATYNYTQSDFNITSSNGLTDDVVYNNFIKFNNLSNLDYDFFDYSNIIVVQSKQGSSGALKYSYYYSNCPFTANFSSSGYIRITSQTPCNILHFQYDRINNIYRLKIYKSDNTTENILNWSSVSQFYATSSSNSYSGTPTRILDFSSYLRPFITLSYLDDHYNKIVSNSCYYGDDEFCSLNINSSLGSYIEVSYDLREDDTPSPIDFLPNQTYQFTTNIIGSNNSVRLYTVNPWFYFGGETSNVDSELYYPINKKIYYTDDRYKYQSELTFNDDYSSYYVYQFIFTYKTNGSSLSTIKVPMSLSINNITSGTDIPIISSPDDDSQIDKDDIIIDQNQQIINGQNDINNSLNNDDVSSSSNEFSSFFSGFNTNTHGLTSIITAPLNLINSLNSKTCTPLILPLPFVDKMIELPCMSSIYSQYFGSFLTIYQTITFGIVSYWIIVRIFNMVKDFKNPDHDEIEVFDL